MIQSTCKIMLAIAIIAIACLVPEKAQADSPPTVAPEAGAIVADTTANTSGAPCLDGCMTGGECVDGLCCQGCGGRRGVCRSDGYCDGCRRLGLLGRIRFCGLFGRRCSCDVCRGGRFGHGGHGGHGGFGGNGGPGGRMLPNGCGGKGCPPLGFYQMVYPVNPEHFDSRDGAVHAAQGYGVPMAVPLAPVVRHQYNYSWGVPASRITHISNHAPHGLQGPGMYGYPGAVGQPGMMAYPGGYPGPMGVGAHPQGHCPQCQAGQRH